MGTGRGRRLLHHPRRQSGDVGNEDVEKEEVEWEDVEKTSKYIRPQHTFNETPASISLVIAGTIP